MTVTQNIMENILSAALESGADFAELYLENTYESDISLKSQKISEAISGRNLGAGLRLFYGNESIYTYTNDLTEKGLLEAAQLAAAAKKGTSSTSIKNLSPYKYDSIHKYNALPWDVPKEKKVSYLQQVDKAARDFSNEITQVTARINEVHKQVRIANTEGLLAEETRQYCYVVCSTVAEGNGLREYGMAREGSLASSDYFETLNYKKLGEDAARTSVVNLKANFAPATEMPVVIANGFGGVIFHEACGHGLETTTVASGSSVFSDKLGQKISNDCVTAIDDGTIPNIYGSLSIDDEGYPTQKTTLIEKGILKSFIVDHMGARKTGYKRTGSGRRQNYKFAPASRMRNTYIDKGDSSLEEMISDIDYGLFAKNMGGGSVNPSTGGFNFSLMEANIIRNGRIEEPVKGASLIGTGIDTLSKIVKVGRDLHLVYGHCGSISGLVPTTVGQPAILVSRMTVGGRA
ncbi:MAG: TldD/PmbA family protein [Bdellovibrionales bacterium]|nr:TldD/PmbA family protein [Bdellovibrionales bacterium]